MIEYKRFEDMEASAVRMIVGVGGDYTNKAYNKVLNNYCRNSSLPGFRKGKVPPQVILRKFGDGIQYESTVQLVNDAIKEALEETEKQPISSPEINDLPKLEPGNPYEFSVTYDVFPEVELGPYRGVTIEEKSVQIQDEDRRKELERLAEKHAVYLSQDEGSVDANSVVTMNFVELDTEDNEIASSRREGFVLNMGSTDNPLGIESQIMGMKIGETRVVSRLPIPGKQNSLEGNKTGDNKENAAADHQKTKLEAGDNKENAAADHPPIKVNVREIKERRIPEMDDEFAQDVSEDLKTLEELKDKIRTEMDGHATEKIRQLKIQAITDKLLEESKIEPPHSMLERDLNNAWESYLQRSGIPENELPDSLKREMMTMWEGDALKSVKTRLIYGRIIEEENLTVNNEEIESELKKNAGKYGMNVEEWEKRFGGKTYRGYLKNQMVEKQLFDLLIDSAQVSTGEKIGYFELLSL